MSVLLGPRRALLGAPSWDPTQPLPSAGFADLWIDANKTVVTGGARQHTAANSEYFSVADHVDFTFGDQDIAICQWVKFDAVSATMDTISKWGGGATKSLILGAHLSGILRFRFVVREATDEGEPSITASNFGGLSTGTWYFVFAWHDASADTINIAVNDTAETAVSIDSTGVKTMANPMHIGSRQGTGQYHDGQIATTGIWIGTIPDAATRTALYNGGTALYYGDLTAAMKTGLVSFWNGNEASGNLIDQHGSHDGTDTNTVTAADGPNTGGVVDGDTVQQITSRDSNAHIFVQTTAAKKPTWEENVINGYPVLRFDGVDDVLAKATGFLAGTSGSIFAAIRTGATIPNYQEIVGSGDEASDTRYFGVRAEHESDAPTIEQKNADAIDRVRAPVSSIAINSNYILEFGSTGSAYSIRINGTSQSLVVDTGSDNGDWFGDVTGLDNVTIGALQRLTPFVNALLADVAEIIAFDGTALTADEKDTVERYLSDKYGIAI